MSTKLRKDDSDVNPSDNNSESQKELDKLLNIISNETSRKIIENLAFEPTYLYRLSKKIQIHHTTVLKQLNKLQEAGIIEECQPFTESPKERQYYRLKKHINIKFRVGQGFFDLESRILPIDPNTETSSEDLQKEFQKLIEDLQALEKDLTDVKQDNKHSTKFLNQLESILNRFDDIEAYILLERQLYLIRLLKKIAFKKLTGDKSTAARKIFYEVLKQPDKKASKHWLLSELGIGQKSFTSSVKSLMEVKLLEKASKQDDESEEYYQIRLK